MADFWTAVTSLAVSWPGLVVGVILVLVSIYGWSITRREWP